MFTSDAPWDPGQLNDDADEQVVYPDDDDIIVDDMWAYINQAHNDSDSGGLYQRKRYKQPSNTSMGSGKPDQSLLRLILTT